MASILIRRFNSSYAARPVLTTMVANALLAGIADSLAQTISITQSWRESRNLAGLTSDRPGIELRDMEKRDVKTTVATGAAGPVEVTSSPARFDPDRLARFVFYGFAFAPVQYKWFAFLSRTFPLVPTLSPAKSFVPVLKRVALDQTVLAPLGKSSKMEKKNDQNPKSPAFLSLINMVTATRPRSLLHLHDPRRGARDQGPVGQVQGRVRPHPQGELRTLADGPAYQLSPHPNAAAAGELFEESIR